MEFMKVEVRVHRTCCKGTECGVGVKEGVRNGLCSLEG